MLPFVVGVLLVVLPQLYLLLPLLQKKYRKKAKVERNGPLDVTQQEDDKPKIPPRKLLTDRVRFDLPASGNRLYPRMFPPNMPAETSLVLDFLFKRIFFQWQSRAMAAKWCANINREFAQLEGKSKIINYVYASKLDLGLAPPSVQNVRILPTDPSRKDLELMAKVMYGGGLSMELHMQIQLYAIIEAHLKVAVRDLNADMLIRISGSTNDDNIYFTLTCAQPPQVEFDINSAVGNFTDLASIRQIVSNSLKAVLGRLIVDPNGKYYRLSPTDGFKSFQMDPRARRARSAQQKKRKVIAPVLGRLFITLREAEVWINRDSNDQNCAPYCMISFNRQTRRSKVLYKTLKPRWDETLTFDVLDPHDSITLSLHDKGRLVKDDFLGHCTFQFGGLVPNERIKFAEIMKKGKRDEDSGIIHFDAQFESFEGKSGFGIKTLTYNKELGLEQFDGAFIEVVAGALDGDSSKAEFSDIQLSKTFSEFLGDADQLIPSDSSGTLPSGLRNRSGNQQRPSLSEENCSATAGTSLSTDLRSDLLELQDDKHSVNTDSMTAAVMTADTRSAADHSSESEASPQQIIKLSPSAPHQLSTASSLVRRMTDNLSIADSIRSTVSASQHSADQRNFLISVTILQARGLMPADRSGFNDPYCIVSIGKSNKKTKVIKGTLSPIWNETLVFNMQSTSGRPKEVLVAVFDKNKFTQHTFLGQILIDLPLAIWDSAVDSKFEWSKTLALQNRTQQQQQSYSSLAISQPGVASMASSPTTAASVSSPITPSQTAGSPAVINLPPLAASVTGEIDFTIIIEVRGGGGGSGSGNNTISVSSPSPSPSVTNLIQVASKQLSQETASHSRSSSEDGRSHSRGSSDTTAPPVPLVPSGGTITQHFSLPPQQPTGPKTTQQLRQISAASLYASKEAAKAMASNISHRFSQYLHSRNTAHSSSGGGSSATANISSSKLETSLSNMAIGNESVAATIINNESSSKLETPSSITTTTTSNNIESPSKPETSSNATSDYKDLN